MVSGLKKVPLVAVEILEDGDGAVGLLARRFEEFDIGGEHEAVVTPEIVGVKEEENAAGGLFAHLLELFGSGGLGEEKAGGLRTGWSDKKPAFVRRKRRVFYDAETEGFREEHECFVVIADEECDVSERLRHSG